MLNISLMLFQVKIEGPNCCFKTQALWLLRSLGVAEFVAFVLQFVLERLQQACG